MNEKQQTEFKMLALKYCKSLNENGVAHALHYKFKSKNFPHEITIYFYDAHSWYFELKFQKKFNLNFKYTQREVREISFPMELHSAQIDKFLQETKEYYEYWLETLEKKKNANIDDEIEFTRKRLEELRKMQEA